MIRKTFICVVGVLAGASTGAYVDGFFEQENLVTNAYHQIANKFDPSDESDVSTEPAPAGSSSLNGDVETTVATTSMAATEPTISKTADSSSKLNESATKSNKIATSKLSGGDVKVLDSEQMALQRSKGVTDGFRNSRL